VDQGGTARRTGHRGACASPNGLSGLDAYGPAVVATQAWYIGPGQQGDVMRAGYDQAVEDARFTQIDWPRDGYRLFEIGHFTGDRRERHALTFNQDGFLRRIS
jgi:hypothetical protein